MFPLLIYSISHCTVYVPGYEFDTNWMPDEVTFIMFKLIVKPEFPTHEWIEYVVTGWPGPCFTKRWRAREMIFVVGNFVQFLSQIIALGYNLRDAEPYANSKRR